MPINNIKNDLIKSKRDGTCHLVLKLTGMCNLSCAYCYLKNKNRKTIQTDYYTTLKTVKALLDKVPASDFTIVFFGGEPLLEIDKITGILANLGKDSRISGFSINTNGILMDENSTRLFSENEMSVSIALDGTQEMHNKYRKSEIIKNPHKKAMEALELLLKSGVKVAARMTIGPRNAGKLDKGVNYLIKSGVKAIGFSPASNLNWTRQESQNWGKSITRCFETYISGHSDCRIFDFERLFTDKSNSCIPGKSIISINPDGSLSKCHRTTADLNDSSSIIRRTSICSSCSAEPYCTFCVPKYGLKRPGHGCKLKKILIDSCFSVINGTNERNKSMSRYIMINEKIYNIPDEVLEKFRVKDNNKEEIKSKMISEKNLVEPPIKGNWYELGESDCY